MRLRGVLFAVLGMCVALAAPAAAQQTGAISGKVVDTGGGVLPGVTVEARSDVLPGPRETVTDGNGEYRLPALPPGNYTVKFELSGMQIVTRDAQVQLSQDTVADATLGVAGVSENVTVTAAAGLIERDSSAITSGISNQQILSLPVGQDYRDLLKLIPGVQVTQDTIRGPSAGGSGQDNVYLFDAAAVRHPLGGAVVARHRAGHDGQRRRQGGRFRSGRRLRHRFGEQVRHGEIHRAAQLPASERRHVSAAHQRRAVPVRV
jgi:Carboxypeptidase regulatory-like domain